jgi:uncharacterized protein with PIN domain
MILRFLADAMLGKLVRWLRILGCDTEYHLELQDNDILNLAEAQGMTLLTRDIELYKSAIRRGIHSRYVKSLSIKEQLAELSPLLKSVLLESRCPLCNGALMIMGIEDAAVAHQPLPQQRKLWLCKECGKIYWHGRHWDTITEIIKTPR